MDAWPERIHDLEVKVTKTNVKVWFAPNDIGLDLGFRWVSWQQLERQFDDDTRKSERVASKNMPSWTSDISIQERADDPRKDADITRRGDRMARLQRLQHFAHIPFVEMLPVSGSGCRIGFGLKP